MARGRRFGAEFAAFRGRIAALELVFGTGGPAAADGSPAAVVCRTKADLADYCKPSAPGALLKASLLCTGFVSLAPGAPPLAEQLRALGSGIEAHCWSHLPQGSGLGTSSILAGNVLAAMGAAVGRAFDGDSIVHAVLKVEQMLTTGGGWQDQVGGLLPGVKIARSAARLPLRVASECVPLPAGYARAFSRHVLLVFTGQARLARNLLQNVIRRWYARLPEICATVDELTSNAEAAAIAFRRGDTAAVGACLSRYWEHKKNMAAGCEPDFIAALMAHLRAKGLLLGCSLCGAGGGGFMVLVTKAPDALDAVRAAVAELRADGGGGAQDALAGLTFHAVDVDTQGMVLRVDGDDDDGA